jgi:hypothetical protein
MIVAGLGLKGNPNVALAESDSPKGLSHVQGQIKKEARLCGAKVCCSSIGNLLFNGMQRADADSKSATAL